MRNLSNQIKICWTLGVVIFLLAGLLIIIFYLESNFGVFIQQEYYRHNSLVLKQSLNREVLGMTENRQKMTNFLYIVKNGGY
jgi:hypothetical protein